MIKIVTTIRSELMMGKKDKKGKRTKKLQDRTSKLPDWKKGQRNQIKKFIK